MFKLIDRILFTFERIWQHRVLVMWALIGLTVATTLALSLPLYVDSVYSELLEARLPQPPFAFRFRYLGAWEGNIGRTDVETASEAAQEAFTAQIGLPIEQQVRYISGGRWNMRLTGESGNLALGSFGIGALEGFEDKITVTGGEWFPAPQLEDDEIPIFVPESALYTMGLQVGDTLSAQRAGGGTVTLRVAGMWSALNPDDPSWIFPTRFFDQVFLVETDTLWSLLEGIENPVDEVAWFTVFDGANVRASDVDGLLARIADGQRFLETVLPGVRNDLAPVDGLRAFNSEVQTLTQQLFIIILPVGGMVFYFVSLVAGMLVSRQQPEDVKLRSRGMSRVGVLTVHVLMWLLMVGVALAIGIFASPYVVRLVAQTTSFLQFNGQNYIPPIVFTPQALLIGAVTGLIAAASGLWLAWRTTGQNINSYRRSEARSGTAWWQRAYLDLMMLIPGAYVLFTLWGRGGLVTQAEDAFNDPLTFIGPTLFALGFALLFLRLYPFLLRLLSSLIAYTDSIPLLMALRELTRSLGRYRGALLMMAFTLSLIGFTSSMADTVDRSLRDTIDYRVGADMVLITAVDAQTEREQDQSTGQTTFTVTGYNPPPIQSLYDVDGIAAFSRVGKYDARLVLRSQRVDGTIIGVDRAAMAAVTRFRPDLATEQLAGIFNRLAGNRTGIIVNTQTAVEYNLAIGQEVTLEVNALNEWYEARVPVVGVIDYFPTMDPNAGFFAIGNIDPIFEMVGTELPYDVWAALQPDVDAETVREQIAEVDFPVVRYESPEQALTAAQAEPARRGVLGFLSVGFVASIVLTLIATIIQSVASFRAQAQQLGALRAMGLGGTPVGTYMLLLQGLATGGGIFSGTGIGVATTLLFLPLMDFSAGLPPYLVEVAWGQLSSVYLVFAGVIFCVTLFTALFLSREQLIAVMRLGDN